MGGVAVLGCPHRHDDALAAFDADAGPAVLHSVEPDECYTLGELVDVPDIAIEVVHRHGGIDKLEVYAGLGVKEVWFWENGRLCVYHLEDSGYVTRPRSQVLPELDLAELSSFIVEGDQTDAVRAYRDALRRSS